jgi:hypothetical protein
MELSRLPLSAIQLEDQESGDDVAVPSISRQLLKLLQPRSQEEHQVLCMHSLEGRTMLCLSATQMSGALGWRSEQW